ncbi:hypothetical protein Back11_12080 [Paenibacillus baekrokdamisoli]|uniref:YqbQ/XkdQ domain-containing protein n=1 Tax=Paenibacillus baekrokdamisoli TaxID=1712516 RepID=A0A3G9J520_9BACL|nr:hypothetical protein [Paenibacillus baekrokdamisoli]MBB3070514.1 hypothetical protein [Paenibacillus baekrokdamisoli]BBH19863.1 hypothetical protein Back11_12080 [Paenibacillus baekrokdamisoli]
MFEIILDNKNGTLWNITELVTSATWQTSRLGKAGSLEITFVDDLYQRNPDFIYEVGNVIRVRRENKGIFYGYIFEVNEEASREIKLKAYDQIRYLLNSESYVFVNKTATEIIKTIISDTQLTLDSSNFADTLKPIPKMSAESQQMLDTVFKALSETTAISKKIYIFYDDFGQLKLTPLEDMKLDLILGDNSLVTNFSRSYSIDSDTYNYVVMTQKNEESGATKKYIAMDSGTIAKWGKLQLNRTADEKLNKAQINEILDAALALKNRPVSTLKIEVLGDIQVRAGSMIQVEIKEIELNGIFIVKECQHKFTGDEHTMSLELEGKL